MEFVWITDGGDRHFSLPDLVSDTFKDATLHRLPSVDRFLSAIGRRADPAIVLIDHGLGLREIARVCKRLPKVRVLVLFGAPRVEDALAALDAGTAGYVPETMGAEGLALVIKLVLSGERYVPALAIEGWRSEEPRRGVATSDPSRLVMLTPRQREVLGLVAQGASNKEVARQLEMCELTVKSHLRAVFRLLGVSSRTEAARTALLAGIGFVPRKHD